MNETALPTVPIRRSFTAATLAFLVLAAAALGTACGRDSERIAYRPASFGENGACYYVTDPSEALSLQAAGLCEPSWVPAPMPLYWQHRYYPYYASPAYYTIYVPAPARSGYAASQKSWGKTNRSAIATEAKKATYRGSNGKTVPAEKIGATKYGAGNRFGDPKAKFGGGGGRGETKATTPDKAPARTPTSKPGTPVKATPSKPATRPPTVKSPSPKPPSRPSSPSKPSSGGSKSFGGGSRGGGGSYGGKR